jgi:hypothetical protein
MCVDIASVRDSTAVSAYLVSKRTCCTATHALTTGGTFKPLFVAMNSLQAIVFIYLLPIVSASIFNCVLKFAV